MPIDYSKWDSLVISDSSSSEEEDVHENQGNGNSPSAENPGVPDHIQELCVQEARQLRHFLTTHPCPTKESVTAWVLEAFEPHSASENCQRLHRALQECQGQSHDFEYEAFQKMWQAGGQETEKEMLQAVGKALNSKGGFACMQLNFYVFNFALRGNDFYSGTKPFAVNCYPRNIEMFWHGIGSWQE